MRVQVHDATSKLTAIPSSPEDFAELLGFLQKLEERRHGLDETYDHVGFPVADSSSFALLLDLMSTQSLISTKTDEKEGCKLEPCASWALIICIDRTIAHQAPCNSSECQLPCANPESLLCLPCNVMPVSFGGPTFTLLFKPSSGCGCASIQIGCSSIDLAIQAFIWLFQHSFGCSNIRLAVQALIWLFRHSLWLFKH